METKLAMIDTDTLNFILDESDFNRDFFFVYNKKLNKILPYISPEEDRKLPPYLQIATINLRDKDNYFLFYSTEFPDYYFNMDSFVTHILLSAVNQSKEEEPVTGEYFLNLEKFFTILKDTFRFNDDQMHELQKIPAYYEVVEHESGEKRIYVEDYSQDHSDNNFFDFQDEIGEAIMMLSKQCNSLRDTIKKAMIDNINMNKGYIEDRLNERLSAVLKIIN
jgi:hypothetical protein